MVVVMVMVMVVMMLWMLMVMVIMPERSFWGVERLKWGMMPL